MGCGHSDRRRSAEQAFSAPQETPATDDATDDDHSHTTQVGADPAQQGTGGGQAVHGFTTSPVADRRAREWAVLDLLVDVVIILDRGSTIQFVNAKCNELLGYQPSELVGQSLQCLIPQSVYPAMNHAELTRAYNPEQPSRIVNRTGRLVTVRCKDGSQLDMRLTVVMQDDLFYGKLALADGPVVVNEQMLTFVSHETRNFLMVAHGSVEVVGDQLKQTQESKSGVCTADALHEMRRAAGEALDALDSAITVMHDLTVKSEVSQSLQCQRVWMTAADLMAKLHTHALRANRTGKPIAVDYAPPSEVMSVQLGLQHVEELIMNLVANASKYATSRVAVTIEVQMVPSEGRPPTCAKLSLKVDDDGPGIAAEDRLRVFDKYVRLHRNADAQFAGSGLGLHLCQVFAAEHDGTVTVHDSEKFGTGTLFLCQLLLPCQLGTHGSTVSVNSSDTREEDSRLLHVRGAVLVVDDAAIVRRLIAKFVQRAMPRAVVAEASSVREAKAHLSDRFFDVIITDFTLPDGDGDDIVRDVSNCWRVCVSSAHLDHPASFDVHLRKPVAYQQIVQVLIDYFIPPGGTGAPPTDEA